MLLVQTGRKNLNSIQSDWNHKAGITCELAQGLSVLWLTLLPAVSWKMKQKKTLKKVSMSTKFSSWLHEEKCDKIWIKLQSYSCNKVTKTWIQISRQNWNGFFSNISHRTGVYSREILSLRISMEISWHCASVNA